MDRLSKRLQEEKNKESKVVKYYHYKDMDIKTPYWFLYPLLVAMYWVERFRTKAEKFRSKKLNKWNDKRTDRILNYVFPKACKVNTSNNSFYFTCYGCSHFPRWSEWSRPWDWYYCDIHNVEILNYLAWDFEMLGYAKTVEVGNYYPDDWITVIFKKETLWTNLTE